MQACPRKRPEGSDHWDPTLWHVANAKNTYYFSVVDINGNQVTVNGYRGNTEDYTVFNSFTINQPSIVPALSKWSVAICI
jgi:hypothetical protein